MPDHKTITDRRAHRARHRLFGLSLLVGAIGAALVSISAGDRVGQPTPPALARDSKGVQRGDWDVLSRGQRGQQAVDEMGVFAIPRNSADVLPDGLARANFNGGPGVPSDLNPGRLTPARSRLTTSALGVTIYATPTTIGAVCEQTIIVNESGWSGGCVRSFTQYRGSIAPSVLDVDRLGHGHPPIVEGLAADNVAGIRIVVSGKPHQARLDRNAFVYVLTHASDWPTSVEVTLHNGRRVSVPLGAPPCRPSGLCTPR
jgi:hypothetical protein